MVLRPVDEIGDNEEIAGEFHGLDDLDFHVQPLAVGFFQLRAHLLPVAQVAQPFLETLPGRLLEQRIQGFALRYRKNGEIVMAEFQFQVAAGRNGNGIGNGLRAMGKACPHLLR